MLLVEDEAAIAILVEDMLNQLGYQVAATAGSVRRALELAELDTFDVAILDANLAGLPIDPVARRLAERRIPFAIITGYSKDGLHENLRDRPVITKPFRVDELRTGLALLREESQDLP